MNHRQLSAEELRQLSIDEFAASLREGVSKRKRPYLEFCGVEAGELAARCAA